MGGIRVADLQRSCDCVPTERGVHWVARESADPVKFLVTSVGGHFNGRDPTVPVAALERRWIYGENVLYIGKAGGAGKTRHSGIGCIVSSSSAKGSLGLIGVGVTFGSFPMQRSC